MCVAPVYLVGLFLFSCLVPVYYRYTFLFEHTVLADTLRPMNRRGCVIRPSTEHGLNGSTIATTATSTEKLRIGVVMMYESTDHTSKAWSDEMLQPLIDVRAEYCQQHGYTLLDVNNLIDMSRPAAWSKLLALEHHLSSGRYDYLFYLDMDTLIMNPDITLESFIHAAGTQPDIIVSRDMNGINTGVFLVRNSPWSLWFLRTAWNQTQLIPPTAPDGKHYLFRWEQRAFHYLTNSLEWQNAGLPEYPGDYRAIRNHFYLLPQCAFNSYILHPFDIHAEREYSQYAPGDFLIHFAGKNGEDKKKLMRYYLDHRDVLGRGERAGGKSLSADQAALRRGR